MATRIYGINLGETSVTMGADTVGSATTDTIELTIDLADGATQGQVLDALDELKNYITEHPWPPA